VDRRGEKKLEESRRGLSRAEESENVWKWINTEVNKRGLESRSW
jgi:hypothetical protein